MKTCDFCGRQAEDAETLTWTTSVENGRHRTFCDTCSREHLRAMEGKLDSRVVVTPGQPQLHPQCGCRGQERRTGSASRPTVTVVDQVAGRSPSAQAVRSCAASATPTWASSGA